MKLLSCVEWPNLEASPQMTGAWVLVPCCVLGIQEALSLCDDHFVAVIFCGASSVQAQSPNGAPSAEVHQM
jgi:hypothetical protein